MISLSNIRYEKRNETGFVLLGGKRTTNAMEAVSGALITRKKSDNKRYFLGV